MKDYQLETPGTVAYILLKAADGIPLEVDERWELRDLADHLGRGFGNVPSVTVARMVGEIPTAGRK